MADCAADDKAIEVTRCSSSMAFTSTPVFGRLLCKLKTGLQIEDRGLRSYGTHTRRAIFHVAPGVSVPTLGD